MVLPFAQFYTEWWFMGLMIVILLGLVGLLLVMRKKGSDE